MQKVPGWSEPMAWEVGIEAHVREWSLDSMKLRQRSLR